MFLIFFIYFNNLSLTPHKLISLIGFCIFVIVIIQCTTGILCAFGLVSDVMLTPTSREEEDLENLYIGDFLWLHERGVDILFTLITTHLLRKLFIQVQTYEHGFTWKNGFILFLYCQIIIFSGLVLCCTHLSEITLAIVGNIIQTCFFFKGKLYWWVFTDMLLNTDTLIRLMYMHYILAMFIIYSSTIHSVYMHYDWKGDLFAGTLDMELNWWGEALFNELGVCLYLILFFLLINITLHIEPSALTYELFTWGDTGLITDVRFYSVSPHWYFRPYMAWLIMCPEYKLGLFGLIFLFIILYYQSNFYILILDDVTEFQITRIYIYFFFIFCLLYTGSFLPYGRFYSYIGGNTATLLSYIYVYAYLSSKFHIMNFILINKLLVLYIK